MSKSKTDKIYVGAIDFGTTYSGYAFSKKVDYNLDPLKIHASSWPGGGHVSLKTSTCVLFDPDKKFHSFGFKAEDKFSSLSENEEHHEWYYFRRFKMMLYKEANISRVTKLKDEQGNVMPAIDVFTAGIRFLKNDMLEKCMNETMNLKDTDIQWVLTIPAIWNDIAKSFMREAAIQAGIQGDQLILALEPEAASIYCKHLPLERKQESGKNSISTFSIGSKYLVLDAGGGTMDITVHEVTSGSKIKEIYKANGGDWGGIKVDEAFRKLLEDIVGKSVMDAFVTQYRYDFIELYRDFEIKKKTISKNSDDRITFKIPVSLIDTYSDMNSGKKIQNALRSNRQYSSSVTMFSDKMRVDAAVAKELFKTSVNKVVSHVRDLFKNRTVSDTRCILMVGGFSESPMLQQAVIDEFKSKVRIIIPDDAGLAVLKGAVIFGHNQTIMKTRICKYTYGISCSRIFDEKIHPEKKKFQTKDGKYHCKDLFLKFIDEGTEVEVGQSLPPKTMTPLEEDDTEFTTKVVSTENKTTEFITDEGCKILGNLVIDMPDTTKGFNRAVLYTMTFGDTELKVKAKDRDSDRKVEADFKFI